MRTVAWALAALLCNAMVRHVAGGQITTSRPFLIDSTVADMQWVNSSLQDAKPNAKTVFVRSTLGSIYRSIDDGMNWVSQRDKVRVSASRLCGPLCPYLNSNLKATFSCMSLQCTKLRVSWRVASTPRHSLGPIDQCADGE